MKFRRAQRHAAARNRFVIGPAQPHLSADAQAPYPISLTSIPVGPTDDSAFHIIEADVAACFELDAIRRSGLPPMDRSGPCAVRSPGCSPGRRPCCFPAASTVRLYLKDGTYQLVREYEVKPDRVRFSARSEKSGRKIPLEMVDLARTKKESPTTSKRQWRKPRNRRKRTTR